MVMGTLFWTCLTLLVPAAAPEPVYFNQPMFKIPIRFPNERRAEIQKFILYVSRDQGKSWECQEQAPPTANSFIYKAREDGVYWFTIATLDTQGHESPSDALKGPPRQKVIVDTTNPVLHVQAERRGDEVTVNWTMQEDNPDLTSLHVDYQTPEGKWYPVGAMPEAKGQATFRPGTLGDVTVRVQLKDLAGNQGEATTAVTHGGPPATGSGAIEVAGSPPPKPSDSSVRRADAPPQPRGTAEAQDNSLFPPPPGPPAPPPAPLPTASHGTNAPPAPAEPSAPRPKPPADLGGGLAPLAPPPPALVSSDKPAGTSPLAGATRGALPDLQYINKRQVKLDFDVSRVGPSGLGGVEVYMTTDEGLTWTLAPVDGNALLPVSAEGRPAGPMHGSVAVSLSQEGIRYGFCVIVKSRAGLGKPPPQKGEPPHVRLELDLTPPRAALYRPQPDPSHPNALILSWMATDRNLTPNPVTLEWAERREGPWQPVSTEPLPNNLPAPAGTTEQPQGPTGTFSWQLPDRMPSKVYLRLTVRDTAGNVSVAQTPEPVLIDLTVPEVGNVSATVGIH
jgi:hypothetical protein